MPNQKIVPFGVVVVDKPLAMTSRRVIDRLQVLLETNRVGHAGTLDPLATGVLLVAIGNATRLVEYFHDLPKEYVAEFEFGKSSDTLDCEGSVAVVPGCVVPTLEAVTKECDKWLGLVQQVPPRYSAVRVKGKRAYQLARAGKDFQPPARQVRISSLEIISYAYPLIELRVRCGSGTYIRSLGHDIAAGLSSSAIMTRLVRTAVGPFHLEQAIRLELLQSLEDVESHLVAPEVGLVGWPRLQLDHARTADIRDGRLIELDECARTIPRVAAFDPSENLLAILVNDGAGHWKPLRVFHKIPATIQPMAIKAKHNPES